MGWLIDRMCRSKEHNQDDCKDNFRMKNAAAGCVVNTGSKGKKVRMTGMDNFRMKIATARMCSLNQGARERDLLRDEWLTQDVVR
ncbi:hypothetical protein DXV75_14330 [Alteromonas aestuariivivens]|uniref:Uncharacterized protein n=1 Tax=Alteromonas aestuariivivens TaxID=1938339 RepID=A0A3D8M483_9ALTE|nr:hypothetical protein [Alteromonas aestuariivivens]RDV24390.1 hypothetical protein DXV75_14330 [Alteromonas aestuariivivens]